jgi:predicted ATPase
MFTSFEAKNFRGFRDLVISELSRVNLIAGMNNVGKTSLLEALFVHCGAYNPELALTINLLPWHRRSEISISKERRIPLEFSF